METGVKHLKLKNSKFLANLSNYKNKKAILGVCFMVPALVLIFTFLILPTILAATYSLQNYNMLKPNSKVFVGLNNYKLILADKSFYKALFNTFYFAVIVVPVQSGVALLLAVLVNKKLRTSTFTRIALFSPVITSIVVVSILWTILYNKDSGLINAILQIFGIPRQPFLLSEHQAMNSIIVMSVWQAAGYQMMIFLAGLQDIAEELYEAASIDGANAWQKFKNITLPCLRNVTNFIILITTIQAFKLFSQPYVMTSGGPNESTKTLVLSIFEQGFQYRNVGYSSAIAMIFFLLILTISFLMQKFLLKEK